MTYYQQEENPLLGRIGAIILAIIMIPALFGYPHFVFSTMKWVGSSITAKFWYIIVKLLILGMIGFCGYIGITGEE